MSTPNPGTTDWVPLGTLAVPVNQVVGCRVYHNASQSIPTNTVTAIAFNSERWDTDNIHDPTTNNSRLTCRTAGKYLIWGHFHFSGDPGGNNQIHFRLNGSPQIFSEIFFPINQFSRAGMTVYDLAVGDYVEFTCYTSASGMSINSAAQFSPEFGMILQGGAAGPPGSQGSDGAPGPAGAPGGGGAAFGLLASRPAASGASGSFYYATDQDVLYLSNGTAWLRQGLPAGATTQVYSNTVPTGWWAYNGTALPSSSGIYADLATHLGGTACPDTAGRMLVARGSHGDVDTIGDNDGVAAANRSPKHNTNSSLSISRTADVTVGDSGHQHAPGQAEGAAGTERTDGQAYRGVPWSWTTIPQNTATGYAGVYIGQQPNFALNGSIGPGGTRPVDMPAYITFSVVIAKL